MSDIIENKVAKSGIITLDLEELKPHWDITSIDLTDYLWQGIALKEKDFRAALADTDWSLLQGKHVFIHCSSDAIIPSWAFMLLAKEVSPFAATVVVGSESDLEKKLWADLIAQIDESEYQDKRVILKGCSNQVIPQSVYFELSSKLIPVVKSLMFGEPCSTVPVYKQK